MTLTVKTLLSLFVFVTLQLLTSVSSKTATEWKSRTIYQLLTDRFATPDGGPPQCSNLTQFCGGTFKGIQNNLDYIQDMGFDAIWISPVVANTAGGYHGYWTKDLYKINENFGTEQDLHDLIQECHSRDIWVMVDVVGNHMGYAENGDYSTLVPFGDKKHYHDPTDCILSDPNGLDSDHVETCWLCGLPDLDQENPFVRETLLKWVKNLVQTYDFDALRIDTVPHVNKNFWADFSKEAGVYTIGEIISYDMPYLAAYQGSIDAVLNYALYSTLRCVFQSGGSMHSLEEYYVTAQNTWLDISVLGSFVNNHDNPRFLSSSDNVVAFKSALAFTLASVGIPIIYYGDEYAFSGGQDPMNREFLWTHVNRESDIYQFIKTINTFRRGSKFYEHHQVQAYADASFYAFSRGEYFFAFTNSMESQTRTISHHQYEDGTLLCNIFNNDDCVKVEDRQFSVTLKDGEVKMLSPRKTSSEKEFPAAKQKESILRNLRLSAMLSSVDANSL